MCFHRWHTLDHGRDFDYLSVFLLHGGGEFLLACSRLVNVNRWRRDLSRNWRLRRFKRNMWRRRCYHSMLKRRCRWFERRCCAFSESLRFPDGWCGRFFGSSQRGSLSFRTTGGEQLAPWSGPLFTLIPFNYKRKTS
jgi:hypothetical protein